MDSQCPGSVSIDESTYQVDWVPRPSAKLAPETTAAYVSHNRSHILPPICEGLDDHVDLDLTGMFRLPVIYTMVTEAVYRQSTFPDLVQHRAG
jgi:nucleoporin POM152